MEKVPRYFMTEPGWYWNDPAFRAMSVEEKGVYFLLILESYRSGGIIRGIADGCVLSRQLGIPKDVWDRCWPMVSPAFTPIDGNSARHEKIQSEYLSSQYRYQTTSEAGKRGNEIRWGSKTDKIVDSEQINRVAIAPTQPTRSQSKVKLSEVNKEPPPTPQGEDLLGQPIPKPKRGRPKTSIDTNGYTKDFEDFWCYYPRPVSKGDAFKAWKQLNPDAELAAEIARVIRLRARGPEWKSRPNDKLPYPGTWLRARGWEDTFELAREDQ